MRAARVVIGANFGDCGKGLITDYLATDTAMVVRYNGGAQAGHTVVTPDGVRHVFHHLGAGSLRGASTFLSEFFVVNPALFLEEVMTLRDVCRVDVVGKVIVSPACFVTTPHDVMINMLTEEARGEGRHGSCGVGINETVYRSSRPEFLLMFQDVLSIRGKEDLLWRYQRDWTDLRLKELKIAPSEKWQSRLESRAIFDHFLSAWQKMDYDVIMFPRPPKLDLNSLIFEGAQGLLLDQDHEFFPFVTHSHTGLTNVVTLARQWEIEHLDVVYVTRSYVTRHGPGPFPGETPDVRYDDETNVLNEWQGSLRFGQLDLELLRSSIMKDLSLASDISLGHHLAMTHLDQCGDLHWAESAASAVNAHHLYVSRGPVRTDVTRS